MVSVKKYSNETSNSNSSSNSGSDNEIKRIEYKEVPKTSNNKLISLLVGFGYNFKDIENKSYHNLKQLYNRYYSNKLQRKLNNYC